MALKSFTAPNVGFVEHRLPRASLTVESAGNVRPLEHLAAAFGMRHHRQVTSVLRADRSDAFGASVRVHRILLGRDHVVVDVVERDGARGLEVLQNALILEGEATFAVRHPTSDDGAAHPSQHDRLARLHPNGAPSTLKSARAIVQKRHRRDSIVRRFFDPSDEAHQLAAIADAQRERILAVLEIVELRFEMFAEADRRRPAFGRSQRVGVAETSGEDNAAVLEVKESLRN